MSDSRIDVTLPSHVILYVGMDHKQAMLCVNAARHAKAQVEYTAAAVTGSDRKLRHYTVIADGLPQEKLNALWKEMNP